MNRAAFYASLRSRTSGVFGTSISQQQVNGIETLLDAIQRNEVMLEQAAYILGGVYHETGGKMVPVREGFASTDAGARAAVQKLFDKGRIKTNYAAPVDGVSYYGRGRIQNTWHRNYEKLEKRFRQPFVKNPDLLLNDEIDAEVTVIGHIEGIWTGKKLADYIGATKKDYKGARRIVNGTDKAVMIAGYAEAFEKALRLAAYDPKASAPPAPIPTPKPTPRPPVADTLGPTPKTTPATPKVSGTAAAAGGIIAALAAGATFLSTKACDWFGLFCG